MRARSIALASLACAVAGLSGAGLGTAAEAASREPIRAAQPLGPNAVTPLAPGQQTSSSSSQQRRRHRPVTRKTVTAEAAGGEIALSYSLAKTDGKAFTEVASAQTGHVLRFLDHPATKLRTEVDLSAGDARVSTANAAPDFPGLYSLWIRRTKGGWELVFNEHVDVWGSQHDASADVTSVPLTYSSAETPSDTFEGALAETEDGVEVRFVWGSHQWSARLQVEGG